jgi:purine-binding chemotaxis protein CheW
MDLAARFGRAPTQVDRRTCIVIVEVQADAADGRERQVMGVMVDAVNAVLEIAPADVEPAPAFGAKVRSEFIEGIGKVDERFVILLDVDQVLSVQDIGDLTAAHAPALAAA